MSGPFGSSQWMKPAGIVWYGGRGVFSGALGASNAFTNSEDIEYITIASTGNATDFGDLTVARNWIAGNSSPTRGLFAGGRSPTNYNTIDYVTIASTGDASDFGDLITANLNVSQDK